jgi:hypothetical protein
MTLRLMGGDVKKASAFPEMPAEFEGPAAAALLPAVRCCADSTLVAWMYKLPSLSNAAEPGSYPAGNDATGSVVCESTSNKTS